MQPEWMYNGKIKLRVLFSSVLDLLPSRSEIVTVYVGHLRSSMLYKSACLLKKVLLLMYPTKWSLMMLAQVQYIE